MIGKKKAFMNKLENCTDFNQSRSTIFDIKQISGGF